MPVQIHKTSAQSERPKKYPTHTKPRPLAIPLDQPGRLHTGEVLGLLNISQSTLTTGIKTGRYPSPDGMDGRRPYWRTSTLKAFLERD